MKRTHKITVDGTEYRLRLTPSGIRQLREKFDRDPQQVLLSAAADPELMAGVLDAALTYKGSENPFISGEDLYDLLVDAGWAGQMEFGNLALGIGVASGLWTQDEANKMLKSLQATTEAAYAALERGLTPEDESPSPQRGR